ncbi:MAG: peptidase S41 [Saprospiraceae bacterium]|nr:peptidase S41 [Saprospiraceae bacterium]
MRKSYFIYLAFWAFIVVIKTAPIQAQAPNSLSRADRLYGVSRFWQEVNYNFVFLDKVDRQQWDSLYKETLLRCQETASDYEYYLLLQKLCASLKDGHTNVYFPNEVAKNLFTTSFGSYRFFLSYFDQKYIITRVNASKKEEVPVGSEIVEVNGLPAATYANRYVKPYIASSTDYVLESQAAYDLLKGYIGSKYTIVIKTQAGVLKTLKLEHQPTEEKEVYPPFENRALLDHKVMDHGVHYLALNSFENIKIDSLFHDVLPQLYKAKGLIIDLRYNGGGNTNIGFDILQYFTHAKSLAGSKSLTREHQAAYKAWGAFMTPADTIVAQADGESSNEEAVKCYLMANDKAYYTFAYAPSKVWTKDKRLVVPTVVLMGNNTASAAEDFLIYADALPHFTYMGDKSFGSTGQPYLFNLPGGGRARVCTKKDVYPDGREFVGYGIAPDIYVKPTLEQYLSNKDVVLEKAMEFLGDKLKK